MASGTGDIRLSGSLTSFFCGGGRVAGCGRCCCCCCLGLTFSARGISSVKPNNSFSKSSSSSPSASLSVGDDGTARKCRYKYDGIDSHEEASTHVNVV